MPSAIINQPDEDAFWDHLAHQFANPPKEFSPVPIWWWSGDRLERGRLRWEMEQLIAGGVYNVVILNLAPTSPLYGADADQPPFMSEAWWDIFLQVCEDAQELGMRIWFYDQIGFSGANLQGEIVRANPSFAGQALASIVVEGEGRLELECPSEGVPLAAAYTLLNDNGEADNKPITVVLDGHMASTGEPRNKRLRLMYAIRRGFDYYNADGCERLLNRVHREFERRAGHFFGSVIVGSFQDELPSLLTWSANFADAFQQIKDYDLRDHLIALWEGEDPDAEQVRVDYHHGRALLAEKAFFRPFFDWHRQHGLVCGFDQQGPARSGHPIGGVQLYADYLQTHRWYDVPGSDHHGNAKIHSSLAHLYDRPRVWIESFHSSGWGGTIEETFDWLLPWLRAGATLYNPHAVYYSTRGGWWEWAPPSTCWRQPYWRHYSIFANTVSRLCFLLSQGMHVCDIGVLYPTTTIQSGLTIEGVLPSAQAAHESYQSLTGTMMFLETVTGVLDQSGRDFDILDDASVQRGQVENGLLRIGEEQFKAIILPACRVLEAATGEQLLRFVQNGGLLIAVGCLPDHIIGVQSDKSQTLQRLFTSSAAILVQNAEEVSAALQALPRKVEAPVPILHRRIQGADVLFVPAAFPHASYSLDPEGVNWLKANYRFDSDRYQRPMKIFVRDFKGKPHLWDAVTGQAREMAAVPREDGVEIEIPFDTAPAALVVWRETASVSPKLPIDAIETVIELPDQWTSSLEQTLDNRYGDFTKPNFPGAPPVQTWQFAHRIEGAGEDGLRDNWFNTKAVDGWKTASATFGTYGWWSGVCATAELPTPLHTIPANGELTGDGWLPAMYSLQRGIQKDELHVPTLGPKGHVPEEFLTFGHVTAGYGIQFRTGVWMPDDTSLHLALAAPARKQVWVNGQAIDEETAGYLWLTPVQLKAGMNLLEWRLIAESDVDLRAYWTLVTDPAAFARPERMTTRDLPRKDSHVAFTLDFKVSFEPVTMLVQVSAAAPCRLLVNDVEAGRQGGFDPYASLARVQPYTIANCQSGMNRLVIEVQDIGTPAAVMVDGIIRGANGEILSIISGSHWQVRRDNGDSQPVELYHPQWLDPAWSHLWRRPHPLPESTWIEGIEADGTVLRIVPDAFGGRTQVEWFSWILPPGLTEMRLPIMGEARLWIDGLELPIQGATVSVPESEAVERSACLRVLPGRGRSGGSSFSDPVTYTIVSGKILLGDWEEQGLHAYSGGVRYRTTFRVDSASSRLILDLGRLRGTAEVWVNGHNVGARVWSPYRFDIAAAVQPGSNTLEILVLNTLAPYLESASPTHYVRPGQTVSGLFGPVRILAVM